MSRVFKTIAVTSTITLILSGCVGVPTRSNVMAMPGSGKNYNQFRLDDATCQRYAQERVGPYAPQAVADNATGTAVSGTLIGATIGALIGAASGRAGEGAAIGAGGGLLIGSSVASDSAARDSAGIQREYNTVYTQCMYAKGHRVPVSANFSPPVRRQQAVPPDYYPPPRRAYDVPPDYMPY